MLKKILTGKKERQMKNCSYPPEAINMLAEKGKGEYYGKGNALIRVIARVLFEHRLVSLKRTKMEP